MAAAPAKAQIPATSVPEAASVSGPDQALSIVNLADVKADARGVMSEAAWAFVAEGKGNQWTLAENRRAFADYRIVPHRLRGVEAARISTALHLLGHDLAFPIIVAPMGAHGMVHPAVEAEAETAAGAGRAGALYTASGASNLPLEQIAAVTKGPKWFQTYLNADEGISREILVRARMAGFSAIVLTTDAVGPGSSDDFIRLGRPFPRGMTFGNNDPRFGGRGDFAMQKTALSLDDIGMIRSVTGLPVVVKSLMRAADAKDAISAGAAAIQVSNHGGRQIDGIDAAISALGPVVDAVAGAVPIIFDSGIREGIDVFKALALGATAVAVGRPIPYGAYSARSSPFLCQINGLAERGGKVRAQVECIERRAN